MVTESGKSGQRGRRRLGWPAALLALAVAGVGLWAALNRPWEARARPVPVETATKAFAARVLSVNGRIVPRNQVDVSSTVSGRVLTVAAMEGDAVAAGAVLATIDAAQQEAAVAQAGAALVAGSAQLEQARVNFERAVELGENISRRDLDAQRLALQTAQEEVNRLKAAKEQAEALLGQYTVRAPFDGTVLIRGVDAGQVASPSTILYSFADLQHLMVEASIDEIYSADIRRGLSARLQPFGYNEMLEGELEFVSPEVDSATGGRLIRVAVDDLKGLHLPIGLTVNVNVVVEELDAAITVPRSAIVRQAGSFLVYVVENGTAQPRSVGYVDWPSARLIVTEGLEEGDVVVTDPAELTPGLPVRPDQG